MRVLWRLLSNVLRGAALPVWLLVRHLRRPRSGWVELRLQPRLVELSSGGRLRRWMRARSGQGGSSLSAVRELTQRLADDPGSEGLLVHLPPLNTGWTAAAGLREALAVVRAADKRLVVYLPQGGGNREMLVASVADTVLLSPTARVALLGLSAQALYIKGLLEKLGVGLQVKAVGDFKTAAERAVRSEMSEPQRQQLKALLGTLQGALEQALSERPGLDSATLPGLFAEGLLGVDRAQEVGLIDGACYEDQLSGRVLDGDTRAPTGAGAYLAHRRARLWQPLRTLPYIAVVPIHGTIGTDSGAQASRGMSGVVACLRRAASDKRALAVVLHIDSPGGSALASDLIHREVVRIAEHKPVAACMGEVAASGGYYVACATQHIVARPETITGSIGVITAKPVLSEALARAGVRAEVVRSAPHADMFSPFRALDEGELELLDREAQSFYRTFLTVVAEGRQRTVEEIEPLAGGRVWSGRDASERGLVDSLGGLDAALGWARDRLSEVPQRTRAALEPIWLEPEPGRPVPRPRPPADTAQAVARELDDLRELIEAGEPIAYYASGLPRLS